MKRGTRTFRWRFKRIELDNEREKLATALLNLSDEAMKIHSEIEKRAFDKLMGDPIKCIEGWFNVND